MKAMIVVTPFILLLCFLSFMSTSAKLKVEPSITRDFLDGRTNFDSLASGWKLPRKLLLIPVLASEDLAQEGDPSHQSKYDPPIVRHLLQDGDDSGEGSEAEEDGGYSTEGDGTRAPIFRWPPARYMEVEPPTMVPQTEPSRHLPRMSTLEGLAEDSVPSKENNFDHLVMRQLFQTEDEGDNEEGDNSGEGEGDGTKAPTFKWPPMFMEVEPPAPVPHQAQTRHLLEMPASEGLSQKSDPLQQSKNNPPIARHLLQDGDDSGEGSEAEEDGDFSTEGEGDGTRAPTFKWPPARYMEVEPPTLEPHQEPSRHLLQMSARKGLAEERDPLKENLLIVRRPIETDKDNSIEVETGKIESGIVEIEHPQFRKESTPIRSQPTRRLLQFCDFEVDEGDGSQYNVLNPPPK